MDFVIYILKGESACIKQRREHMCIHELHSGAAVRDELEAV